MALHVDDLKSLANSKVADATLLFLHRRYSNSYYLFGYGLECGLKAIIAKGFLAGVIPDKTYVSNVYTHRLEELVKLAGLQEGLSAQRQNNPVFDRNWVTVADWSEAKRYEFVDEFTATAMAEAMKDDTDGVFGWLKSNW
tara:strand:- start:626 stop:1045 length:420 start_codon:yes stop_codon:yes gene_type:complete